MNLKLEDKIEASINEQVLNAGFEIEYVEFVKEGTQNILRIVIDKPNFSVSIDDCELISRTVEEDIDKLVSKEYILEISSPGVERQLKNIKLYRKYTGSKIYIKLYKKSEFGKEFEGILESVDTDNEIIILNCDEKKYNFEIKDIASAHTVYNFDEILKLNKNNKTNINELKKF